MADYEDPAERIERLMATAEPRLAEAFLRMVASIRSAMALGDIADAIERGDWVNALDEALKAAPMLSEAFQDSFIAAARDTAKALNRAIGNIQVVFDMTNDAAVAMMQRNTLRLVTAVTNEQRDLLRRIIMDGINSGTNPREIARLVREVVGLTPSQARAVESFRRSLEQLDSDALRRILRDRRFDPTLRAAIENQRPLTSSQINQMVSRYHDRMLVLRAQTIARTEALRSAHEGARATYEQAIQQGVLDPSKMTQEWNTSGDERVRHSHSSMQGQVQTFGTPFVSGLGNFLAYPGDPSAPAEDVINCRCAVGIRMSLPSLGTVNE